MKLVSTKKLSEILSVKESTLYAWASKGVIPSHKLNGLLRFDVEEIESWIKSSDELLPPVEIKPKTVTSQEIERIVKWAVDSVKHQGYNASKEKARPNQASKERR